MASRLTLNCIPDYVEVHKLNDLPVTIIDVFDEYALSSEVREETYKCYPNARLGHLKSGGNFPYLSRSEEVNLYLQVYKFFLNDNDVMSQNGNNNEYNFQKDVSVYQII